MVQKYSYISQVHQPEIEKFKKVIFLIQLFMGFTVVIIKIRFENLAIYFELI